MLTTATLHKAVCALHTLKNNTKIYAVLFVIEFFGCCIFTKYEYIALQQSVFT